MCISLTTQPIANEVRLLRECKFKITCICLQITDDTTSLQHLSIFIQQSSASTTVVYHLNMDQFIPTQHYSYLLIHHQPLRIHHSSDSTIIYISSQCNIKPHLRLHKISYQTPQVTNSTMTDHSPLDSSFVVLVFSLRDDLIACLNKAMDFLIVVASSRFPSTNNQLRTSSNPRNHTTIQDGRVTVQQVNDILARTMHQPKRLKKCKHAVLMANMSNYASDVILEVPHSATYLNDMENQSVDAMQDFKQTPAVDFIDNKIHSDSNIILYSQYLQETQQENEKANKEQNNESVTAELERYKERVKTFEQRLNIDLSSREKMIDSQMDDMIKEKLALKEQVDSLEQNLSKQIKEKECLLQTFTVFKSESKEKEDKYMENEIDLEKKIKELDNILFKVGQSAQTVHMLTKPQAFYDNIHKQALGYQNPFHLKKAQRIKPTLYDGIVISDKHVAMPVIDDEETLILEEKSRSKMSEKGKDPEVIKKNISHKHIDYEKLNRLSEDFRKHFTPQQEMDAEQAFWFCISNPTIDTSNQPPINVEVPNELPKVSLVNASLKKLKFHLAQFDSVVKKRTTPDART
ncbi:hypothetical protein Tco_0873383 [Tanacetum coccineum]